MPVTSRTPLAAATHVYKWWLDVNTGSVDSPVWTPCLGFKTQQFNPDNPTVNDVSDMDSAGWKSNQKDAAQWSFTGDVLRKVLGSDATSYDPGQEFIRLHSIGVFGAGNTFQVRIYEMEPNGPREEAYLGLVNSSWQPQSGGMDADETVTITLNGNGALTPIAHPDTGTALATVSSVTPSALAAAGGDLVTIRGNRFTGATDVKFGTTSATSFTVQSDGQIAAVAPAHAAGTVSVNVTNGAGAGTVGADVTYA